MIFLTKEPLTQVIVTFFMDELAEDIADEDWELTGFGVTTGSGVIETFGTAVTA